MTDPRVEALAEALVAAGVRSEPDYATTDEAAAAILAALPPGWCGHGGVEEVARRTRDLLANYLWNEDDSGDENDLIAAYDELRAILGPSTEVSVGETLAREPTDSPSLDALRALSDAATPGR